MTQSAARHAQSAVCRVHAVDCHCHILPGIDDGPATLEESMEMARALSDAGYAEVYCTPHRIRWSYDATAAQVRSAVIALQAELDRAGIAVRLHPGREHYLDEFLLDIIATDPLPLGRSRLLLVELPDNADQEMVKHVCYRLTCGGYRVMIAHPERNPLFALPKMKKGDDKRGTNRLLRRIRNAFTGRQPLEAGGPPAANGLLAYLDELGCKFQANLGSFCGMYGERVQDAAFRLAARGIYATTGTDLHSIRQADILRACRELQGLPEQDFDITGG